MNTLTPHPLANCSIILASQSPRRSELLTALGIPFTVAPPFEADERIPSSGTKASIPVKLAMRKAKACPVTLSKKDILLAADTMVYSTDHWLGKPRDEVQACAMLAELSGTQHEVFTGVCLRFTTLPPQVFCSRTLVRFAQMSQSDIDYYVNTYKPFDKAGAYGIQEWLGYACIESIEGSYSNVMGLPTQRLYAELLRYATTNDNAL